MKPYTDTRDKKSQIRTMFDNIAPTYDRLNHLLSLNIDRLWRRDAVRAVAQRHPSEILDAATGTGDMALALAKAVPEAHITGLDLSEEMLAAARTKASASGLDRRITLTAGDAEHMPFADCSFDAVTVAFGVRNFGDLGAGLREMHRVLRKGGVLAVLELSTPDNPVVRWFYRLYLHVILPRVGGIISRDVEAYEYLPASVDEFPAAERFAAILRESGFSDTAIKNECFGIARLYTATK